jgi:hypothetical protein
VDKWLVVVPWYRKEQVEEFSAAWGDCEHVLFVNDVDKAGCGATKNKGVAMASQAGASAVVVLDDDCGPSDEVGTICELIEKHAIALRDQRVQMFMPVTFPRSRGTPYRNTHLTMPVACSMGYWDQVGDYDAPGQLVYGDGHPMTFERVAVHGRYFPLSGMNIAFRPGDWLPWCQFIEVKRFDDIWMGWLWQKKAYLRGHCFNLNGPKVRHRRQSNVWQNLREESQHLEANETIWSRIAQSQFLDYDSLRAILPV